MIATPLSEMLELEHPILLAPMGGVSGGRLAAAVSNAGGFGLVGGGYGDAAWLREQLALAAGEARRPWGVGLITWSIRPGVLELALEHRPRAVMLSFGDPAPYAERIKRSGAKLICQVQDVDGARQAVDAGADIVVAQGTEAGGHGGRLATLPLALTVLDAVGSVPVVAAGGIADGRGVAAALMLGAQAALIGTRFYASHEALGRPQAKQRLVEGRASDTSRTRVFDVVRGLAWPEPYTGRALRNRFLERWEGKDAALRAALDVERPAYFAAHERGDYDTAVVWAGEGVELIERIEAAESLVARLAAEAAGCLRAAERLAGASGGG